MKNKVLTPSLADAMVRVTELAANHGDVDALGTELGRVGVPQAVGVRSS